MHNASAGQVDAKAVNLDYVTSGDTRYTVLSLGFNYGRKDTRATTLGANHTMMEKLSAGLDRILLFTGVTTDLGFGYFQSCLIAENPDEFYSDGQRWLRQRDDKLLRMSSWSGERDLDIKCAEALSHLSMQSSSYSSLSVKDGESNSYKSGSFVSGGKER